MQDAGASLTERIEDPVGADRQGLVKRSSMRSLSPIAA